MKISPKLILALLLSLAVGCTVTVDDNTAEVSDKNQFEGLYQLHVMEQRDSVTGEWGLWRDGMEGYILYDANDNMAVHLTLPGYKDTDLVFQNFVDTMAVEQLRHLTGSYVYFAKYEVDDVEKTVQHARISHSNPNDWDVVVKRRYEFRGDTLILAPVEQPNASLRLKWVRAN